METGNLLRFGPLHKDLRITAIEFYNELDVLARGVYNKVDRRTGANLRASLVAVMLLKYTAHWFNCLSEIELEEGTNKSEPFDHEFKLQFSQVKMLATDLLGDFMTKDYEGQKDEIETLASEFMRDFQKSKLYSVIQRKEKLNKEAIDKLTKVMNDTLEGFKGQTEQ